MSRKPRDEPKDFTTCPMDCGHEDALPVLPCRSAKTGQPNGTFHAFCPSCRTNLFVTAVGLRAGRDSKSGEGRHGRAGFAEHHRH